MSQYDLDRVNAERRRRGLPTLSQPQAKAAVATNRSDDGGWDASHFLIGYMTGIPMPSAAGITGAMLHQSSPAHASEPSPSYEPAPSYEGGGGTSGGGGGSASYDSGGSSPSDSGGGGGGGGSD